MKAIKVILICSIILSTKGVLGQSTDPIEGVAQVLSRIDAQISSEEATQLTDQTQELADSTNLIEAEQAIEEWRKARIKSHTSESGLKIQGGYDHKFGDATDDFDDNLYAYRHRLHVMLSWDMLGSGLFGRKSHKQRVALESKQEGLKVQSSAYAEQIYLQSQEDIQFIAACLNRVYLEQITLYESLIVLSNKLRNQGHATKLEQAELSLQISMVKGLIRPTPIEVEQLLDIDAYIAIQERIEASYIDALAEQSSVIQSKRIDEELLQAEIAQMKYWRTVKVSPYVRAQHYADAYFADSRVTANVGVTATLPIFSGRRSQRSELRAQSKLMNNATEQSSNAMRIDIGDVAMQLNRNLDELHATMLLEQLTRKQIELAHEAYAHKQLSMQELAKGYIKLLDLHANLIKQIEARESLKMKLMLTAV